MYTFGSSVALSNSWRPDATKRLKLNKATGLYKNRVFSHDVTVAILVSRNNETAAMLVSQTNPLGVELFSYANTFFCSNKFALMLAWSVKTLSRAHNCPDKMCPGSLLGRQAFPDSQCTGGRCCVAVVSSVAVCSSHLSTNRMRFYFFQPKCVVIVSSLYDFPTREGLWYEFCSFRFLDPVEDLSMKQFCSVFPDGFLENFTKVRSMFETFLAQRICSYVGELESLGQGWKHKPRAQI